MFFSNHTRFELFNLEKTKKCSHAYYSPECTFSPWCILPVGLSKKAESFPATSQFKSVKWYFDVHYITASNKCQDCFVKFLSCDGFWLKPNGIQYQKNPIDFRRQDFRFGRDDRIWTCGFCVPNAVLYQTEPHLEIFTFHQLGNQPDYSITYSAGCQVDFEINFYKKA